VAVGRVGELEIEDLGVVLGLLQTVVGFLVRGLCLDDGQHQVRAVTEQVVGALLWPAASRRARHDDPAIRERLLLANPVVVPAGRVERGEDVLPTGIGLSQHSAAPGFA
jgi:hypothetical protein